MSHSASMISTGAINAARPSGSLAGLFPPGVIVTELLEPGDPEQLLAEEAAHLGRAVEKRVREFAAGRLCARRALSDLGVAGVPIRVGAARQPLWPDGFTGSITHTEGFCAAAVARLAVARSVGIDTENCTDVRHDLWSSICAPGELEWLASLSAARQAAAAALIFSAKEAFYKCQYPLTSEFLGFHDVTIKVMEPGGFSVLPTRGIAFERHAALPWRGRYREHGEHGRYLTAGMSLPP